MHLWMPLKTPHVKASGFADSVCIPSKVGVGTKVDSLGGSKVNVGGSKVDVSDVDVGGSMVDVGGSMVDVVLSVLVANLGVVVVVKGLRLEFDMPTEVLLETVVNGWPVVVVNGRNVVVVNGATLEVEVADGWMELDMLVVVFVLFAPVAKH